MSKVQYKYIIKLNQGKLQEFQNDIFGPITFNQKELIYICTTPLQVINTLYYYTCILNEKIRQRNNINEIYYCPIYLNDICYSIELTITDEHNNIVKQLFAYQAIIALYKETKHWWLKHNYVQLDLSCGFKQLKKQKHAGYVKSSSSFKNLKVGWYKQFAIANAIIDLEINDEELNDIKVVNYLKQYKIVKTEYHKKNYIWFDFVLRSKKGKTWKNKKVKKQYLKNKNRIK